MKLPTFGEPENGLVDVKVEGEHVGTIERHDNPWTGTRYTVEGTIAHECGLEYRSFKTLAAAKAAIGECF